MATDDELIAKADQLNAEFQEIMVRLQSAGSQDDGPLDGTFDGWKNFRDGMVLMSALAKLALLKSSEAIAAEDAAIETNFKPRHRTAKRREVANYWKPIVAQLKADLNTFQMLTPSISERWFDDPFGRHQERYRGTSDWTNRVRDNGVESTDSVPE